MDGTNPEPEGFFSLASEIRNQIYKLLFEYDEPLHIAMLDEGTGKIGLHRCDSGNEDGDEDKSDQSEQSSNNDNEDASAHQGDERTDDDGKEISAHESKEDIINGGEENGGEENGGEENGGEENGGEENGGEENGDTDEGKNANGEEACDHQDEEHSGDGDEENSDKKGTEDVQHIIRHDLFVPALPTLLVCRQIYEEASAILYKNNTFVFIRNYNGGAAEYEVDGDFLTAVAVPWIYKLGSRASLLRKIIIDNGCICPSRCATPHDFRRLNCNVQKTRTIDVGPFISTLWRLDLDLTITVKHSIGGLYTFLLYMSFGEDDLVHIPALETLIRSIYRDEYDVKRYLRTLGGIHVFTDASGAALSFVSPRPFIPTRDDWRNLPKIRDLASMANYSLIEVEPGEEAKILRHDPCELLTLPTSVIGKILGYVQGDGYKTVKLDDAAGRLESLGPYSINKRWRHLYGQDILTSCRYKFEVTRGSKRANKRGLCNLNRLLRTKHNFNLSPINDGRFRFGEKISGQIRIIFDSDEANTLQDVEYNLTTLLTATLPLSGGWEVVTVLICPGNDGEELSYTTSLDKLRRHALKLWPPYSIEPTGKCPSIWVNGFNQLVEVGKSRKIVFDDDTIWVDEQSFEANVNGETGLEEVMHEASSDGCYYACHDDTCEYPRFPWYNGFRETFRYIWWQTVHSDRAK